VKELGCLNIFLLMKFKANFFYKPFPKHFKQVGSSLIEILIATFVLSVVLIALISTLTYSIKSTTESNNRSEATKLAQEGMELFERQRTLRSWQNFTLVDLAGDASFCLVTIPDFGGDFQTSVYKDSACVAGDEIGDVLFVRQANITYPDSNTVTVEVVVSWPNPKGSSDHDVILQTEFRKWDSF
jgi:Tfp pilus assembly protein PilV